MRTITIYTVIILNNFSFEFYSIFSKIVSFLGADSSPSRIIFGRSTPSYAPVFLRIKEINGR